uniref:B-related factor 1 n=1 Tax=Paramoeba aestuarina TaxID=180227 RepID=A0A7S4KME6_9EUKA|mmetsp:Transcript_21259/g.33064  ORF Transcript_21259/g.33064 Transcript_21259/m.33064 type:complete len:472 (+) Transcript_21259:32-1447(+)
MECPKCGSNDIQTEGGQSFCCVCGCLVEEYNIVSEVTFLERANGSSSMGGFVIGPNSKRCAIPGMYDPTEGRMQTLERAKRLIQEIASQRELGEHFVEAAHQIYKLAAKSNFVRGRRSSTVCACCLYAICRQEQSPHLLLDFADALQINVFVLGHTFLRLCQLLHLQLPVIDPAIYIPRFAAELNLGEKTDEVSNFAVRLIGQMKRDWMSTGRGHAGICGAALLMSARRYGFPVTQKQMIEVVRICSLTLSARLKEFGETPTSTFSFAEFDGAEEREQSDAVDPPAFKRARLGDKEEDEGGEKKEEEIASFVIPQDYSEGGPHAPLDIPEIPDDEIDNYINTTEETETKTKMWEEMNSDYLEQQKLKQENPEKKTTAKRKRRATVKKPTENTAEAMSDMLKKKVSTKINYTALEGLFTNTPGSSASEEKSAQGQRAGRYPSVLEFGNESGASEYDEYEYDDEDEYEYDDDE